MTAKTSLSTSIRDTQLTRNSSEGAAVCQPSQSVFWSPGDKGHAGLGKNRKLSRATVAPVRQRTSIAMGATLLENPKQYLLAIARPHHLLSLQADS